MAKLALVKCTNPLDRREREYSVRDHEGETLEELRNSMFPADVDVAVSLNGKILSPEQLRTLMPKDGDCIVMVPVVGKNAWRFLAMIAILVIAYVCQQYYLSAYGVEVWSVSEAGMLTYEGYTAGSMMAANAVAMAVAVGGGMLVNALLPVSTPTVGRDDIAASQSYSWNPQTVQQQGGVIPRIYGKNKMYGNIIDAYLSNKDDKQYMNVLICLGYGRIYQISDYNINDQPRSNFQNVEPPEVRLGDLNQSTIGLFNDTYIEHSLSMKVVHDTPVTYTCPNENFDGLEVDILFPKGLFYSNNSGGIDGNYVDIQIDIRKDGGTWYPISKESATTQFVDVAGRWSLGYYYTSPGNAAAGVPETTAWYECEAGNSNYYSHYEGQQEYWSWYWDVATWHWISGTELHATNLAEYSTVHGKTTSAMRRTYRVWGLQHGTYDVRVTKISEERNNVRYGDDVYLNMVREVYDDNFTYPRHVLVAIKALATDQLSGSLRFSCIVEGAIVKVPYGTGQAIASGSVTQANMYLSLVNGYSHITIGGVDLAPYANGNYKIVITDSAGKKATGYLKAAGTYSTGSSLVTNGDFESDPNAQWTPTNGTIASVAGGQSGNCLQLTRTTGTYQDALQYFPVTVGALYVTSGYVKSGTSGNETYKIGLYSPTSWPAGQATGTTSGSWVNTYDFVTADAASMAAVVHKASSTAGTMLFDSISVQQVLSPGSTGATIVSEPEGTTYNWYSIESGFNYNDSSGYTYAITNSFEYSNNPAWVAYDVLTQPVIDNNFKVLRYDGYTPSQINLSAFKTWADWCDELVSNGKGGTEKRSEFDGVFDVEMNLWDAFIKVCVAGRAAPLINGTQISVVIDKPETPVQMFSVGSIGLDTFKETFLPLEDRASELELDFINRDNGWEREKFIIVHTDAGEIGNRASMVLFGTTRATEAWRQGMLRLYNNELITRTIEFECDVDALACQVGDVINIQHDVPQWGFGGRIVSGSNNTVIASIGSVTCQLSVVAGTAFVTNPSVDLNPYIGHKIIITDNNGKTLTGWVKDGGASQTLGSEIGNWVNGYYGANLYDTFTNTSYQISSAISDGSAAAKARSDILSGMDGKLYKIDLASYVKNSGQDPKIYASGISAWNITVAEGVTYYSMTSTDTYFYLYNSLATNFSLNASIKQVITPSQSGVTIVSTKGGTTYNWTSEESGFNRNATSYSIQVVDYGVTLDQEVTIEGGVTYQVMVRLQDDTIVTKTVSTAMAGTYTSLGLTSEWSVEPQPYDPFAFGAMNYIVKPFRVIGINRSQELKFAVTALEYNEDVYHVDTNEPVSPTYNYSSLVVIGSVTDLAASERLIRGLNRIDTQIDIVYNKPPEAVWSKCEIWVKHDNDQVFRHVGDSVDGSFTITQAIEGVTYTIKAVSQNMMKMREKFGEAPEVSLYVYGKTAAPTDVASIWTAPSKGGLILSWTSVPDVDLDYYVVRVNLDTGGTWERGIEIGRTYGTTLSIPYAHDGLYMVKAVDTTGNESANAAEVIVDLIPSILDWDSQESIICHSTNWSGEKTDMRRSGWASLGDLTCYISAKSGEAFITSSSIDMTPYINHMLTISGQNKTLRGYVKSVGTGETLGSDLITNGGFSDTSNWTAQACTISSIAGGQSGNCLKVVSNNYGYAYQGQTLTDGTLYKMDFYVKESIAGTPYVAGVRNVNGVIYALSGTSTGSWVQRTGYFTSPNVQTDMRVFLGHNAATSGEVLYDTVTMKKVNVPAVAGWNIVSTQYGSTYSWYDQDDDFNRNLNIYRAYASEDGEYLNADIGVSPCYYTTGQYDIGSVQAMKCTGRITWYGIDNEANFDAITDFDAITNFDGTVSGPAVEMQMSYSQNGSTWTDWQPFVIADATGRYVKFRIKCTSTNPSQYAQIATLQFDVDLPSRTETGSVTTSASGNMLVTFGTSFVTSNPVVIITIRDATAGDTVKITNIGLSSFRLEVYNGASRVVRVCDWFARGF